MKICVYVQDRYSKTAYKKESYNIRINAGIQIVKDILERIGYMVDFAGKATVHKYDVVLWQCTSDCDWWDFIAECQEWRSGQYKVVAGGAGVLNARPFLDYVDYFVLGRAEGVIEPLIRGLDECGEYEGPSVINSKTFSPNKEYFINQVACSYPHEIKLENGKTYKETSIGCNHKCNFCGYTWHRKHLSGVFSYDDSLWGQKNPDVERAILDMENLKNIDYTKLRTTAIDGVSERLRFMANKKITKEMIKKTLVTLVERAKPHQLRIFNIVGYPTETAEDYREFPETLDAVDAQYKPRSKQFPLILHNTPFRAMPATPFACKPMVYQDFRGVIAKRMMSRGGGKGKIFFKGGVLFAVESMATDSLPTVIQSAIVWRGLESDAENIKRLARSKKFTNASAAVKLKTLEKYFDVARLFREQTPDELPTKYLKTYAKIEKMW